MTAAVAQTVGTGLPPLGGRLVLAYRVTWVVLAVVTAAVIAESLHVGTAHPAVLTLRLFKAAILISVCAILLRRRASDPVAALLSLALLTWTISSSFDFAATQMLPQLLDRVRYLLFALALLLFPDGRWNPRWTRALAVASAAVFVIGLGEASGVLSTHLYLPLAIACVVGAISALIARFRTAATESVRQQLKWIALGLVLGVGLILTARSGAALSARSPMLASTPILWEGLFQLGIVTIALGFMISLLRYRLFDAETAISRSAALAGVTVAMVATFAGTEATIELIGQQYLGMGIGDISAAMAAAVAAVLLNPLHSRISDWAESRFQRDLVTLKKELPELLAELSASASPRQLGAAILPRIDRAVHATRSALMVEGRVVATNGIDARLARKWVKAHSGTLDIVDKALDDPVFPMRMALHCPFSGRSAWLLLGPRPDGSLCGGDDFDALGAIIPPLRQSLSWAFSREQSREHTGRQLRTMQIQIDELRRILEKYRLESWKGETSVGDQ
jgi:hypothetical protein